MNKMTYLAISIIVVTGLIILGLYLKHEYAFYRTESFYAMTPEEMMGSIGEAIEQESFVQENGTEEGQEESEELPQCQSGNWWDNGPVKAIRSKIWGASYNLVYKDNGNIKSPVLIPINNPHTNAPPSCLAATETGWHESAVCSESTADQRWLVKLVDNEETFKKLIDDAKETGSTVGFTYGYKMENVDYPFFVVVSADHPAQALYYSGSALGVRPLGNYDDQKWDILKDEVKDAAVTHHYNIHSKLTPELQVSPSTTGPDSAGLSGCQNLASNPQALATMLHNILKKPNEAGAFGVEDGLKINMQMDDAMIAKLTGETADNGSSNNTATVEGFSSQYPKNPMDISVTLNYALASFMDPGKNGDAVNGSSGNVEVIPNMDISNTGEFVPDGTTSELVSNSSSAGSNSCDESKCQPDMNEWLPKPYPCTACVSGEGEGW